MVEQLVDVIIMRYNCMEDKLNWYVFIAADQRCVGSKPVLV